MRRSWVLICLIACCLVMAVFFLFTALTDTAIYLVHDAFDPIDTLIKPHADNLIVYRSPYYLGHLLPGLNGMAFVFGSQAQSFHQSRQITYLPAYSTRVVIAVNQHGQSAGLIDGWQSLLNSKATVLIPDNGTEYGRLAAIALAGGLGAPEGDLAPALAAYRRLAAEGRLNPKNEYASTEYRHMYQPHRPRDFDAVIMLDYQARTLERMTGHWEIVTPVEGTVTIDCGFVYGGLFRQDSRIDEVQQFLESGQGRAALIEAGFSPLTTELTDLSSWGRARLLFNPGFRRTVRQDKLYAPASVRERLLLKSITFLLFCLAAQAVIRHIPRRLNRNISIYALLLVMLWMLTGIMKTVNYQSGPMRLFWFASYFSRHGLPVFWYWMCHIHVSMRLPERRLRVLMLIAAGLLSVLVMTNDWHRQVFIYHQADPVTWEHQYSNGWGYYLSMFFSFAVFAWGMVLLIRQKKSRQQKKQYLFAGLLFLALIAYQFTYILGMEQILDLDIPSTVALFILLFILSAQQGRFMGAVLLALPTFQKTQHALAIYDPRGAVIYQNQVMSMIGGPCPSVAEAGFTREVICQNSVYKPHVYPFDHGSAVFWEDITELKNIEQSLAVSHKRLEAIHQLLLHRTKERPLEVSRLEAERYGRQMDRLFTPELTLLRKELQELAAHPSDSTLNRQKQIRFRVYICQQRLRLLIRSLEAYPEMPAELVSQYADRLIRQGRSLGLDGVLTANLNMPVPVSVISDLLAGIDRVCLCTMIFPGSSLICRLESSASDVISLRAFIASENNILPIPDGLLTQPDLPHERLIRDRFEHKWTPEGLSVRLQLTRQEADT